MADDPMQDEIELITLDLDDTLWPCASVIERAESALYEWLQQRATRVAEVHDLDSLRRHRRDVALARPEIAHDLTAVRRVSMRLLLEEHGYPATLAEPAIAVFRAARNEVTPFPEVVPALHALRRRYRLVSLTNGNAEVHCTPLHGCFQLCLSAAEVGAAKPEPALFERALEAAGVPPGRALQVGDHPELDVRAAQQVGMRTAWVNRDARPWPAEFALPDLIVNDLWDLQRRLVPGL
jgi:FMN hydrolase / 5-amino-6-(5-phospho-D-ribitylamino)uracil phosphatase